MTRFLQEIKMTGYLLMKRELAGRLKVDIYQACEGDKGSEGESRKERKGISPTKTRGKEPFHCMCHLVYFKLKKRTGKSQGNR